MQAGRPITRIPAPRVKSRPAWGRTARVILVGLAAAVLFAAEPAAAQTVTDEFTEPYRLIQWNWYERLSPIAQRTFLLLAGIEFAVSAYVWGFRRQDFDDAVAQFFLKFLLLSVLYFFLVAWIHWGPLITNSLAQAGQIASGQVGLSPTAVAELGIDLHGKMMSKAFGWGLLINTADSFAAMAAGFIVTLSFAVIAVQLVIALVESYIVIGTGVFFIGLAAFRGTSSFTDRYFTYAFSVGIRLFLLYLLVGVGQEVAGDWIATIDTMSVVDYKLALRMVVGSLIFAGIVVVIPNRAARQLTDGASFGLPEALKMR